MSAHNPLDGRVVRAPQSPPRSCIRPGFAPTPDSQTSLLRVIQTSATFHPVARHPINLLLESSLRLLPSLCRPQSALRQASRVLLSSLCLLQALQAATCLNLSHSSRYHWPCNQYPTLLYGMCRNLIKEVILSSHTVNRLSHVITE